MTAWGHLKADLGTYFGIDRDLLHIPIGIGLFLLFALLFRRRPYTLFLAFFATLLAQLVNEAMDVVSSLSLWGTIWWREAASDTLLTIALPGVLLASLGILTFGTGRLRDPLVRPVVPGDPP